ncbi:MAG TPA: DUF3090 family protein [Dehalococcoidia bacterium]
MTLDLGTARGVDARAFGQPGERTFQMRVVGRTEEAAVLWLEKQQLQALSLALSQVLAQTGGEDAPATDLSFFPDPPDAEVHVGRMAVGYDPADKTVVIQAHDLASDEDGDPDVLLRLSSADVAQLSTRLKEIVAAGRPTCPLCGVALDGSGHTCIRSNGHSEEPIPRDRIEDDEEGQG